MLVKYFEGWSYYVLVFCHGVQKKQKHCGSVLQLQDYINSLKRKRNPGEQVVCVKLALNFNPDWKGDSFPGNLFI